LGFRRDDFSISDVQISDLVPFVCGIDDAAVPDDGGVHVRGAHACSVLVAAFCGDELFSDVTVMPDC